MSFLKSIWKNNSKHKKLSEEQALKNAKEAELEKSELPEAEKESMTFKLKYLGNTVVDKNTGEDVSRDAVKNIIKVAKASVKKIQRVNVTISLNGITVTDIKGNDMFAVSIYRISNSSTDKSHRQVFSFITTDEKEVMECHAFLSSKRKVAEVIALTLAHAFSNAYESAKHSPIKSTEQNGIQSENTWNAIKTNLIENNLMDIKNDEEMVEEKLIDFDTELIPHVSCNGDLSKNDWVGFDDDFEDGDFENGMQNSFLNDLLHKTKSDIFCDNVNRVDDLQCWTFPKSNNNNFTAFS
ncbi:hypothetical protein FQA39_LY15277 [Lamprigera yunnana]|nr:hypothetical protein FQA39_LY15277 [Lamprigera yunnana]